MKRKRVTELTASDNPSSVFACRAGAAHRDRLLATEQQLHDDLIAANPVRLGPVHWLRYDTTEELGRLLADEVIRIHREGFR